MTTPIYVRLAFLRLRRNLPGLVISALAIALATLVVIILVAAAHAIGERGQRATQWELPSGSGEELTAPTGDPLINFTTGNINGAALTIMEVAAGGVAATPAPLGLDAFPAAGTVLVSPALQRLVNAGDVDVQMLGGEIVGELPPGALIDPAMLAAVRGWDAGSLLQIPGTASVASFPLVPYGRAWWQSKLAVYMGLLLLGVGVLLPCAALVGATARLSVSRQRRYIAGLRLIGATRSQTAWLIAIEAGLAGLCGGVVGIVAFVALRPALANIRVGGAAFLRADITPGFVWGSAIVLAVALVSCVSALRASRAALRDPLATARGSLVNPLLGRWGIGLVVVSVVLLLGAVSLEPEPDVRVIAALVGPVGLVIGVAVIGPSVIAWMGRARARRANTPATLLAARAVSSDATSAFRPAVGLLMAIFFATLANGYATGNIRDAGFGWAYGSASVAVTMPGGDPGRALNYVDTVEQQSAHVVPLWQTGDERSGLGVDIARCTDLAPLEVAELPTCNASHPVLAADHVTPLPGAITVGHTNIEIPADPPRFADVAGSGLSADLIVDPILVTREDLQATRVYRILAATDTAAQSNLLAIAAAGILPGSTTRLYTSEQQAFNEPVVEARRLVNGLLLVTLLLATASVITATIGRALSRGPTYARLRAAGTPVTVFTRALFIETFVVLILAVVGGLVMGTLVAQALVSALGGVFAPSVPLTLWITAAGLAIPLVATLAATPTMKRASDLKFTAIGPQG